MDRLLHHIQAAPVASALSATTIVVSLIAMYRPAMLQRLSFFPVLVWRERQYHRLLSSCLVHGGYFHLAVNIAALIFYGFPLEQYLGYLQSVALPDDADATTQTLARIWGHSQFAIFYLLCELLGGIPLLIAHRNQPQVSYIGASGAISGVMMGAVILSPYMRESIRFLGIFPGWLFVLVFLLASIAGSIRDRQNVAHNAHAWGALAGILLTAAFHPAALAAFFGGFFR